MNRVGRKVATMKFGELVAIARECHGWTLRELETRSGVSNALISQIETGKVKEPGFHTVVLLCDALNISIERAAKTMRMPAGILRRSDASQADSKSGGPANG